MKQYFNRAKIFLTSVSIVLLLSANSLNAQCYFACVESCEDAPTYIVSTTTSWSGSHRYCMGDNDLLVTGPGTILTIDGPCIEFNVINPREIVVDSGATLVLTGGTKIYGSAAKPWKGIRVKSGGTIIIEGTTVPYNATIAFAVNAILAENTTSESIVSITGASFCDNISGIRFQPFSGVMLSSVVGSKFSAQGILGGKFGFFSCGIYLDHIKPPTDFLVGDGLQYHFGLENEFEDLKVAIRSDNSNIIVADNLIHDVVTGIKATGSLASPSKLQVGQVYDPLFPHKVYNVIENCTEGVVAANNVYTKIYQNKIISDYSVASGAYKMDRGVKVTNSCPHVFLYDVTIEGFNKYGVYIDNIPDADSIYIKQSLILEPSGFGELITPAGIWISDAVASAVINIDGNQITNVLRGIELLNVMDPQIYFNLITYKSMTDAGGAYNAYGIKLTNCEDAIVGSNSCIGNYVAGLEDVVRGIYTDYCTNFLITDNLIADAGYGLYIYEVATNGQIRCNFMDNCNVGIYLLDIGGDAGVPPLHSPMGDDDASENHWFPEATANRITTDEFMFNTNAQYTIWNYDDDPLAYNIPGFIVENAGLAPTLAEMDRDGDMCLAYTELLADELQYKAVLKKFEKDFAAWKFELASDGIGHSATVWYMLYSFWKSIHENDIAEADLNDQLFEIYAYTRNTNIPLFVSLGESISNLDIIRAEHILDNISPTNEFEYYWKLTSEIYLHNIDSNGVLELNVEDERLLRDLAGLNASQYGPGVFYARGMLDSVIEHNRVVSEVLVLTTHPTVITISPNPASNYIYVSGEFDKIYTLEVCSVFGEKVFTLENIELNAQISLPQLNSGLYHVVIRYKDAIVKSEKLVIIH